MIVMITAITPSLKASRRPASVENRGLLINILGLPRRAEGQKETCKHDQAQNHRTEHPAPMTRRPVLVLIQQRSPQEDSFHCVLLERRQVLRGRAGLRPTQRGTKTFTNCPKARATDCVRVQDM